MTEVVMPRLSDSMEEGTILKWLKADGDAVARGEPLAEIETDKATLTYEADAAGVLTIVAPVGETLPIGSVIARLDAGGNGASAAAQAPAEPAAEGAAHAAATAEPASDGAADAAPTAEPASEGAADAAHTAETPAAAAQATAPPAERPPGRVKASPLARRLAREHGIELHALAGT
ncbi:MAG TPA: biotin/lipoyl-containing protein, partial [Solirubrobacteraceae bacterium]|nr:biotin/lipoyl-containing protein [Solirubrobacteraceae bacterium]